MLAVKSSPSRYLVLGAVVAAAMLDRAATPIVQPTPVRPIQPTPAVRAPVAVSIVSSPLTSDCANGVRAYLRHAVDWTYDQTRAYAPPDYACPVDRELFDAFWQIGTDSATEPAMAYLALLHATDYDRVVHDGIYRSEIERRRGPIAIRAARVYMQLLIARDAGYAVNCADSDGADITEVAAEYDRRFPTSDYRIR